MKHYLSFVFLFLLTVLIFPQQSRIIGVVQDKVSGEALPGANIVIDEIRQGTVAGEDGEFVLENIPPGV